MDKRNCKYCQSEFLAKEKNHFFCSQSCAAKFNNQKRKELGWSLSQKSKNKTRDTFISKKTITNQFGTYIIRPAIDGPYTKLYLRTCKYSGIQFYTSSKARQIHPELARNKTEYTNSCQFKFGISSYPLWFTTASELITKHGWYSTPGSNKAGIRNVNGISRDHLYSITDGWINKIPAKIIRHPANCSLIPHKENQSKHKKSKITIEELYQRINDFDKLYGTAGETRTPDIC